MKNKNIYLITIIFLLIICLYSCGKSREDKTIFIIEKLNLVENQQIMYEWQIEYLKYHASGNDSIKLIEIENKLSDKKVLKRLCTAFDEVFTNKEINDLHTFFQTDAFDKFFNLAETYELISEEFSDIESEIEELEAKFDNKREVPIEKFEPIPINRKDGFYATIDYDSSLRNEDVVLESAPSITSEDILEVIKVYHSVDNSPEIEITLTKDGAQKFYLLTKENVSKPIAIVIEKQIVSMPIVNDEIKGGKVQISGNFTEEEIDNMIVNLLNE